MDGMVVLEVLLRMEAAAESTAAPVAPMWRSRACVRARDEKERDRFRGKVQRGDGMRHLS